MANRILDDSSDDDFSDNLQLAERLRINRGHHHKKKFMDDQSSSSSSLDTRNDLLKASTSRGYTSVNKKRQNGDKNVDFLANPKRTCLSNRLSKTDFQNKKKSQTHNKFTAVPPNKIENSHYSPSSSRKHLFADKTYEDHVQNLAGEFNTVLNSSKRYSKRNGCRNTETEDLTGPPNQAFSNPGISDCNKPSTSWGNSSSKPDLTEQYMVRPPENDSREHSRMPKKRIAKAVANGNIIVHCTDSGSEDESKALVRSCLLKGGRQSPEPPQNQRKVIGRKIKKKVLDSDDDSEDDHNFKSGRQHSRRGFLFSSSDSEDEGNCSRKVDQNNSPSRNYIDEETFSPNHMLARQLKIRDNRDRLERQIHNGVPQTSSRPFRNHKNVRGNSSTDSLPSERKVDSNNSPSRNYSDEETFSQNLMMARQIANRDRLERQIHNGIPPNLRPFRNRKNSRGNSSTESLHSGFQYGQSPGSGSRGRNRVNGSERYARSGSPHPRTMQSPHTRLRRADVSKSTRGRSLTGSQAGRANVNLATAYPDLFDAEGESSEVEFFTANSYSDTETSAESFGGLRISTTVRNPDNDMICEHSINVGSSEDEISVIFSTLPRNGEPIRVENQLIRSQDSRRGSRALGRRRQRGTWRQPHGVASQDVVSLSPDPVEQVRQVEDDERFARMLQAQFDSEIDPDYTFAPHSPLYSPPSTPPASPPPIYTPFDARPVRTTAGMDLIPPGIDMQQSVEFLRNMHSHLFPLDNPEADYHRYARRNPRLIPPNIGFLISPRSLAVNNRGRRWRPPIESRSSFPAFLGDRYVNLLNVDESYEGFLQLAEMNGDVPRGLQRNEINRLPTRKYLTVPVEGSSEMPHKRAGLNKECQVCLTDYENGDTLRILPCFHEFHTPCIDPWLLINHTCPVCRVIVDLQD